MSMLNGKLSAHGIDDFEAFVRNILGAQLRSKNSYLRDDLYEEALEYLLVDEGWLKLVGRYDPSKSSYTFSSYAGYILRLRLTDWYRKHPEFGDSRTNRPRTVPLDLVLQDDSSDDSGSVNRARLDEALGSSTGDPGEDCGSHLFGGALERGASLGLRTLKALDQPRTRPAGRRDSGTGKARAA